MNCISAAWEAHHRELHHWARRRLPSSEAADDLMQDLFLKALRQGERFCALHNARAWLFEVARNLMADRLRLRRDTVELPDDLQAPGDDMETVDRLTGCLPRVLQELNAPDREAITQCDLHGVPQADYALAQGLSLSAAKSRLQRARQRLKLQMSQSCRVQTDATGKVTDFTPRT